MNKYRPSTQNEYQEFKSKFCDVCIKEKDCQTPQMAMKNEIDSLDYPKHWKVAPGSDGDGICTDFSRVELKTTYQLLDLADPTTVNTASVEVDVQIFKIQRNLFTLSEYIKLSADLISKLDMQYKLQLRKECDKLTKEKLNALELPKTQKVLYAKLLLAEQYKIIEDAKNQKAFYVDLWKTQQENLMGYKKTRNLPGSNE